MHSLGTGAHFTNNDLLCNGFCVSTFESSYSDGIVTVTYHRKNGLDGKVSRVQVFQ